MSARILVVDDIPANVRLLEAKLAAEYFEVITASSGQQALDIIAKAQSHHATMQERKEANNGEKTNDN